MQDMNDEYLERICYDYKEYLPVTEAKKRRFYLTGEIHVYEDASDTSKDYYGSVDFIIKEIIKINCEDMGRKECAPILIFIDSCGGDVSAGFSLIDTIEASRTPVYTINMGRWESAGFYIGIAGDKRYSFKSSRFLLHEGTLGVEYSVGKVEDTVDFFRKFDREITRKHILAHSNFSEEDFDKRIRLENYFLAEQALEYGFIDEIITSLEDIL